MLALSLRRFTFDVVLHGTSPLLLANRRLLGEGSSVRSRYGDLPQCRWYGLMHRGFLWQRRGCDGVAEVTTLHIIGIREPELSPSLEVESSSLGNSLRMACSDGDPLWAMPPTTVLE
jgi:hypothetical protein